MFKCFNDDFGAVLIDQQARKFGHKLTSHRAVSLENISRLILAYPKNKIVCSRGLLKNGDDFENAQHEHGIGMSDRRSEAGTWAKAAVLSRSLQRQKR